MDEDFIHVHREVKKTLEVLLIAVIEAENPGYTKSMVESLLQARIQGSLSKRLAIDMISAMYSNDSARRDEIIEQVNTFLESMSSASRVHRKNKEKSQKAEIKFRELEKIILDNLLRTHRKYLKNIRELFREQDVNNQGYITKPQFDCLMYAIDPFNGFDRKALYDKINPHNIEYLTFSELVRSFAQELFERDGTRATILELIHTNAYG